MKPLWKRQTILTTIRNYFYSEGFLEADTPLLIKGTCPDAYIDSIPADGGYLATSTEYQIKRLIVEGYDKVFTLTKNFRANDRGRYHSTEFTMLEWGRAKKTLHDIEEDVVAFTRKAFSALYPNQSTIHCNGHTIEMLNLPWERLTVREAFKKHLGVDNLGDFSLDALVKASKHLELPEHFCHDKYLVMAYLFEQLQQHLGTKTPTFLLEWPAYLTTSAPINAQDPHVADRSELYIAGIEVADGFPFLRDAALQRKLFNEEQALRKSLGKPEVMLDEKYMKALETGMPEGAGMALGFDRLVMALLGCSSIAETQAFSWEEL